MGGRDRTYTARIQTVRLREFGGHDPLWVLLAQHRPRRDNKPIVAGASIFRWARAFACTLHGAASIGLCGDYGALHISVPDLGK